MLRFQWKLFFGFLTFGMIVIALTALQGRVAGRSLAVVGLAVVASMAPALFIAWRLNRPIRVLTEGITRVAQGNLDVTLPHLRTRDEFEPLIDRFNEMVAALRETQALRQSLALGEQTERVLREASQRLEARVRERTRELEQTIRERDRYLAHSLDLIGASTPDGRFTTVNPAFERVLGYTAQELTSGPFLDFVHPDDVASTIAEMKRLNAGMPSLLFENRYRCKDGSYKWLQWTAIPLPDEQVIHAIGRDVTDRRRAEAAEQALFEASLQMEIAQNIQASLLPAGSVQLEGFDLAGLSRPVASVGGDYFDFIPTPGNRLVLAIGDASGHGLSAALVMAQLHACLWSLMISEPHPIDEVLARANAMLYAKTPANCYATAMLVVVDGNRWTLTGASCGHPPGYVLDRDGAIKRRIDPTGQPLGCFAGCDVTTTGPHALDAGDTLVLLTDGILEAASPEGGSFGEQSALDVVRRHLDRPARAIAEAVHEAVGQFCGRSQDDATIVVAKVMRERGDQRSL